MRIGCCSLSEFKREAIDGGNIVGGWDLVRLADGSHMKEGASRDWGFEDIVLADGEVLVAQLQPCH